MQMGSMDQEKVSPGLLSECGLVMFVLGSLAVGIGFGIAMDGSGATGEQFYTGAAIFMGGLVMSVLGRIVSALSHG
jgi:hypothetical protein